MSTTPSSGPEERVPFRRLALWSVVMALVVAGVVLWFRHGRAIVPILAS